MDCEVTLMGPPSGISAISQIEKMFVKKPPSTAQHGDIPCPPDQWVYRVLRRNELPWDLRTPPDLSAMSTEEIRGVLLPACAFGNSEGKTSPLLHTTTSLVKAARIFSERSAPYSSFIVRWLKLGCNRRFADLATEAGRKHWLEYRDNDTDLQRVMVDRIVAYAQKDKEVVFLEKPDYKDVDVWDTYVVDPGRWRNVRDVLQEWQRLQPGLVGPTAATSQIPPPKVPSETNKFHM